MKISITDDDGTVFAIHELDEYIGLNLRRLITTMDYRVLLDTEGADVSIERLMDDLTAASRKAERGE